MKGERPMGSAAIKPARVMRIIRSGFVFAGVMLIYVAMTIPAQAPRPIKPLAEMTITLMALADVALGFFSPRLLMLLAMREVRSGPEIAAMSGWLMGNVVGLAFIFSCNLFAMVLHFVGAQAEFVALLFGVGMISLLVWRPGEPPVVKAGR
jgi:hypothetical protein